MMMLAPRAEVPPQSRGCACCTVERRTGSPVARQRCTCRAGAARGDAHSLSSELVCRRYHHVKWPIGSKALH
eukprot:scaffold149_cov383-Prasinococcus_capsulatus_cf.AAC.24